MRGAKRIKGIHDDISYKCKEKKRIHDDISYKYKEKKKDTR